MARMYLVADQTMKLKDPYDEIFSLAIFSDNNISLPKNYLKNPFLKHTVLKSSPL